MKIKTPGIFLLTGFACLAGALPPARAAVDFVKDIEPILRENCIKCHGPEKQKGDLRLDSKAAAFAGGKDGQAITPGHADKSDLYRRIILPAGSDDIMPSKGDPLTKAQTDLIEKWINEGAVWPDTAIAKAVEAPPATSVFDGLMPIKSSPGELAAVAKLEAAGTMVRPIAVNVPWREANFHTQGTNITDSSIAPLKEVLTLVDLNLGGTKTTDAGLQNIENLTNLVGLHLEHTQITDAGLTHLKKLSHLTYLNLYATGVTDAGLEELKGLSRLSHLYVWQTKVTADGAANLKKALPSLVISRGWENEKPKEEAKAEMKPDDKKEEKKEDKK